MLPLVPSEAGDLATLWWLFPVGSALLRGDSVGMLGEAVERVPAGALPVITTTWVLSGFRPDARLRFRCRLDEPAAGRALAWVSLEGVGVAPSVPTLGDRPASGHSLTGVTVLGPAAAPRVEVVGRCGSRGRLVSWLAAS